MLLALTRLRGLSQLRLQHNNLSAVPAALVGLPALKVCCSQAVQVFVLLHRALHFFLGYFSPADKWFVGPCLGFL